MTPRPKHSTTKPASAAPSRHKSDAPASNGRLRLGSGASVAREALDFTFVRGSGPGGQHVNKTSTKAQLRVLLRDIDGLDDAALARLRAIGGSHVVGEGADEALLLSDQTSRSQADNRDACVERFTTLVAMAAKRPKVRRKTKPTRGSIERRLESKKRESEKKRERRGGTQ